jgi:hypothetical protein
MIFWMLSSTIAQNVLPLGKLQPFWRNHPVLGPFLQQGLWLDKVPDYFLDTDFPYKKRPFEKEVLFADHLSVVRLLGGVDKYPGVELNLGSAGVNDDGIMRKSKLSPTDTAAIRKLSEYDFVFRHKDGTLGFRPELVKERLKPYMDNGYNSFTIVLDNIPWCLRKEPLIGGFGQAGPPDDPEEWYLTVKKLCETLKQLLGEGKANLLRFRIGTEMNGLERFHGTEERFITHYDYSAAAISDVLPGARLGLYNITAASVANIKNVHNINSFKVLEHASSGLNEKSGKPNIASPFVASSRYFCEKNDLNEIYSGIDDVWDYVRDSIPGYSNFSREIHEYGAWSDWTAVPRTGNPGAFGNAMNLQVVINHLSNGLSRLFLWNMLEHIPLEKGSGSFTIPSSQLWGYSVLDYMAGGEAYRVVPEKEKDANGTVITSLLSVKAGKAYLLVTSFNPDRLYNKGNEVVLKIPKTCFAMVSGKKAKTAVSDRNHSMMDEIRKDVEMAGNLNPVLKDKPYYIPSGLSKFSELFSDMGAFKTMISTNIEKYKANWKESLTLKDFNGTISDDKDNYIIKLKMITPESAVIVFDIKK